MSEYTTTHILQFLQHIPRDVNLNADDNSGRRQYLRLQERLRLSPICTRRRLLCKSYRRGPKRKQDRLTFLPIEVNHRQSRQPLLLQRHSCSRLL
jgi:hypothetical protein